MLQFGVPTHRLVELLDALASKLYVDAKFLYFSECMLIAINDSTTMTTEMKLVKDQQSPDIDRLEETRDVYKAVAASQMTAGAANDALKRLLSRKPILPVWATVILIGLACACIGPVTFGARLIDMPFAFILGSLVGLLEKVLVPRSDLYRHLFDVTAAAATSFLSRALGSIDDGNLFCFSALAQSSMSFILPGYLFLCSSLEMQTGNLVAGATRMAHAILQTLLLGFGTTAGTSLYGAIHWGAVSTTDCPSTHVPVPDHWKLLLVPPFTLCLALAHGGNWRKPASLALSTVIATGGYAITYYSHAHLMPGNPHLATALAGLAIGLCGNLFSRLRGGVAPATILPAVLVQVPSGLAAGGSLVGALSSAEQIEHKKADVVTAWASVAHYMTDSKKLAVNTAGLDVALSMVQIALGLTVGLLLSTLIVYPRGKKGGGGLFSF